MNELTDEIQAAALRGDGRAVTRMMTRAREERCARAAALLQRAQDLEEPYQATYGQAVAERTDALAEIRTLEARLVEVRATLPAIETRIQHAADDMQQIDRLTDRLRVLAVDTGDPSPEVGAEIATIDQRLEEFDSKRIVLFILPTRSTTADSGKGE